MMAVVANKDIRPPLGVLKIQDGGGGLRGGFWDFFSESFQQSGTLFFLALSLAPILRTHTIFSSLPIFGRGVVILFGLARSEAPE